MLPVQRSHFADYNPVNKRNTVGQQLPTLLDVKCGIRLHTLLHVVGSCCLKYILGDPGAVSRDDTMQCSWWKFSVKSRRGSSRSYRRLSPRTLYRPDLTAPGSPRMRKVRKTGQTFEPTTPKISFVLWSPKRSGTMDQSDSSSNIAGDAHAHYTWSPKSYELYPSHDTAGHNIVESCFTFFVCRPVPLPTRTQQLPT